MYAFNYHAPKTVRQAATLLGKNADGKVLAGGQTLLPTMKQRLAGPSDIIDLSRLDDLRGIEVKGNQLVIGAAMRHHEVASSAVVKKALPALAELANHIGDPQVRNRGTIGGSISNNDPAADYPAAVLALDATIVTTGREIRAGDFFQGMFATALAEGEIVVRIIFNLPQRAAYRKFAHPASGYAMTGVFVAQTAGGVRVGVTGAAAGVFRWTEAEQALTKKLDPAVLEGLKLDTSEMNEDIHATREYRANLVRVMTGRAVQDLLAG